MVTRLYFSSTVVPPVRPANGPDAGWSETTNNDFRMMDTAKTSSAMTSRTETKANTADTYKLIRTYVSRRLDGAQTISGTLKGTIRCLESAANDNLDRVRIKLYVISSDGASITGTAVDMTTQLGPTAEFNTSLRAKRIADGDSLNSVSANDNDRIVMEIGFGNSTTGASISGDMNFGDDSASDLGDNETDTAANNPFLELSATLTFKAEEPLPDLFSMMGSGK